MSDYEDYEGDVIYEVWRNGGNPDIVDRDECRDYKDMDYYPDEAAESIFRRQTEHTPSWDPYNDIVGQIANLQEQQKELDKEKENT